MAVECGRHHEQQTVCGPFRKRSMTVTCGRHSKPLVEQAASLPLKTRAVRKTASWQLAPRQRPTGATVAWLPPPGANHLLRLSSCVNVGRAPDHPLVAKTLRIGWYALTFRKGVANAS
jgi:hypothetical protein